MNEPSDPTITKGLLNLYPDLYKTPPVTSESDVPERDFSQLVLWQSYGGWRGLYLKLFTRWRVQNAPHFASPATQTVADSLKAWRAIRPSE
jgi:hypothetical protein